MSNITPQAHRIQWLVKAGDELIPHEATMRGTWAFEARCSCGWESRTGGAVRSEIKRQIADHKADVAHQEQPTGPTRPGLQSRRSAEWRAEQTH